MALQQPFLVRGRRWIVEGLADVVSGWPSATHHLSIKRSEFPLEDGAEATDHAVTQSMKIDLQGCVSDLTHRPAAAGGGGGTGFQFDSRSMAANAWEQLVELFRERRAVTVTTPIYIYRNMMIVSAKTTESRDTAGGLNFELNLEEVLFVGLASAVFRNSTGPAAQRPSNVAGGPRGASDVASSPTAGVPGGVPTVTIGQPVKSAPSPSPLGDTTGYTFDPSRGWVQDDGGTVKANLQATNPQLSMTTEAASSTSTAIRDRSYSYTSPIVDIVGRAPRTGPRLVVRAPGTASPNVVTGRNPTAAANARRAAANARRAALPPTS